MGRWIAQGTSALVLASYLVLAIGGMAHHAVPNAHAATAEHGDDHHGPHPHAPDPAMLGDCCSVMACGPVAVALDNGGKVDFSTHGAKGFLPTGTCLKSIVLGRDPPVPRSETS